MCQVAELQVDKHKAFQNVVVEHKVNVEMASVKGDFLLPCNEAETPAEFKQKFLQVVDNSLFQILFLKMRIFGKVEEFQNIGVTDNFFVFRLWLCCLNFRGNSVLFLA